MRWGKILERCSSSATPGWALHRFLGGKKLTFISAATAGHPSTCANSQWWVVETKSSTLQDEASPKRELGVPVGFHSSFPQMAYHPGFQILVRIEILLQQPALIHHWGEEIIHHGGQVGGGNHSTDQYFPLDARLKRAMGWPMKTSWIIGLNKKNHGHYAVWPPACDNHCLPLGNAKNPRMHVAHQWSNAPWGIWSEC